MTKSDEVKLLEKEFNEWGLNEESPGQEAVAKEDNPLPEIAQELTEVNRELLDHIAELERESAQTKEVPPVLDRPAAHAPDWEYTDAVSEELPRESHLSSVIKNFEEEIDAAMTLENSLQADFQEVLETISSESAAKADLEARADLLGSQAALVDDLRKEIQPTEEDRNRITKSLAETQTELKSVTGECNVLNEKNSLYYKYSPGPTYR